MIKILNAILKPLRIQLFAVKPKAKVKPKPRSRRGRIPTRMLLTNKQIRLVMDSRINTSQLAKEIGVSWPTADKLRRDLCPFYDQTKTKTHKLLAA
jgi:hypothetical protein